MSDPTPADMKVSAPRKSLFRNLSVVWLVPLVALGVSLGIAWQNYADRGTLIEIAFRNASGVVAGETTLRYRDVVVGTVEDVRFTSDLGQVLVYVRVDNDVAPFIDDEATFWVVRPEVSARGISGLSTVLSGVYIEGAWDNIPGAVTQRFAGTETPPLNQPGRPGRRITLATDDGTTISYGSPVLFRGVEVGRLEAPRLSADGRTVLVDAFIDAPHDTRLTQATRFWDTSGFELTFGTAGFSVDFDSLASLVTGGVSFDDVYEDGEPLPPGYVFTLYEEEEDARRNTLVRGPSQGVSFAVQFSESVNGLEAGDDVTYQGLEVGVVTELRSRVIETQFGPELSLLVNVAIDPQRMGLPPETTPEETVDFFRFAVETGMRARLATESLLSSDLRIELVVLDDAPAARLTEVDGEPPRLPSIESNLSDFTATAEGVLERINALPIEEVMQQAISLMDAVEQLARNEDLQRVPGSAVALLDDTRAGRQRGDPGDPSADRSGGERPDGACGRGARGWCDCVLEQRLGAIGCGDGGDQRRVAIGPGVGREPCKADGRGHSGGAGRIAGRGADRAGAEAGRVGGQRHGDIEPGGCADRAGGGAGHPGSGDCSDRGCADHRGGCAGRRCGAGVGQFPA
ncbi:intermembrane transport protein PqiB [Marivita sp.]|uniref:PqiB family protein n=1 Tax=Marivita sp. TaxID=2003365 RepID=UPI003A88767C